MNRVFLIGNLTRDPELSETPNGISLCRFGIAVNRNYSSADGERQVDFFNITVWRAQAENCGRYLKKGSKVAVLGSLQSRTYEDKEGQKRTVTDIVASEVEFLTSRSASDAQPDDDVRQSAAPARKKPELEIMPDDENLPF